MSKIHIHSYSIQNGKRTNLIKIDRTINESDLPDLWEEIRAEIGSVATTDNRGRKVYVPDCYLNWRECR